MTEKQPFKLVATTMDIPKIKLRSTPFGSDMVRDLSKQLYEKALENLIDSLKDFVEEDAPYDAFCIFAIREANPNAPKQSH